MCSLHALKTASIHYLAYFQYALYSQEVGFLMYHEKVSAFALKEGGGNGSFHVELRKCVKFISSNLICLITG